MLMLLDFEPVWWKKGFAKRKVIAYDLALLPVTKYTTLRVFFAWIVPEKYNMVQIDAKSAFIVGKIEEELYMLRPEGFTVAGNEDPVYRLRKAIYGLKQASRSGQKHFYGIILRLGCSQSAADARLNIEMSSGRVEIILIVYVDDIIMSGVDRSQLLQVAKEIKKEIDIGIAAKEGKFLDIVIECNFKEGRIWIRNCIMIGAKLKKFNRSLSKSA